MALRASFHAWFGLDEGRTASLKDPIHIAEAVRDALEKNPGLKQPVRLHGLAVVLGPPEGPSVTVVPEKAVEATRDTLIARPDSGPALVQYLLALGASCRWTPGAPKLAPERFECVEKLADRAIADLAGTAAPDGPEIISPQEVMAASEGLVDAMITSDRHVSRVGTRLSYTWTSSSSAPLTLDLARYPVGAFPVVARAFALYAYAYYLQEKSPESTKALTSEALRQLLAGLERASWRRPLGADPPPPAHPRGSPPASSLPIRDPPASQSPRTSPPASPLPRTSPPASQSPRTSPHASPLPRTSPHASLLPRTSPHASLLPRTSPPASPTPWSQPLPPRLSPSLTPSTHHPLNVHGTPFDRPITYRGTLPPPPAQLQALPLPPVQAHALSKKDMERIVVPREVPVVTLVAFDDGVKSRGGGWWGRLSKTKTSSAIGSSATVRRLEDAVLGDGIIASAYATTCSRAKALFAPTNLLHATFSESALSELDGQRGQRVFTSVMMKERAAVQTKPIPTCTIIGAQAPGDTRRLALSDSEVRARAGVAGSLTYAGNWVLMVCKEGRERPPGKLDKHVAVIGFFDCPPPPPQARGRVTSPGGDDPERMVKHMNLCTRAHRESWSDEYTYLFSGSFVACAYASMPSASEKAPPAVAMDANSGSWALAKRVLFASGLLHPDEDTDATLDAAAVAVAGPLVREVIAYALRTTSTEADRSRR